MWILRIQGVFYLIYSTNMRILADSKFMYGFKLKVISFLWFSEYNRFTKFHKNKCFSENNKPFLHFFISKLITTSNSQKMKTNKLVVATLAAFVSISSFAQTRRIAASRTTGRVFENRSNDSEAITGSRPTGITPMETGRMTTRLPLPRRREHWVSDCPARMISTRDEAKTSTMSLPIRASVLSRKQIWKKNS